MKELLKSGLIEKRSTVEILDWNAKNIEDWGRWDIITWAEERLPDLMRDASFHDFIYGMDYGYQLTCNEDKCRKSQKHSADGYPPPPSGWIIVNIRCLLYV